MRSDSDMYRRMAQAGNAEYMKNRNDTEKDKNDDTVRNL